MDKQKISKALTLGLINGYGGRTKFTKINRGGFEISSSHFQDDKIVYHDEWTNNGGQELIKIGNHSFTRVYAGGTIDKKIIQSFSITVQDIGKKLKNSIINFGDKTRLFSNFKSDIDRNWRYQYQILDKNDEIQITVGKETIFYKNQPVFIHVFVLSPIKYD